MNYYIVDDLASTVNVLTRVIENQNIGTVVGHSTDPSLALSEIRSLAPDIVFVDLLMPKIDGISLVKAIKSLNPDIRFIMISQVSDKDIVSEAYSSGIEFFISKPINVIEVKTVATKVMEAIEMQRMISGIRSAIGDAGGADRKNTLNEIRAFLGRLGMLGEGGTKDLIDFCTYIAEHGGRYSKQSLGDYCKTIGEESKIVKQRMRRTVKKGLNNAAALSIDDAAYRAVEKYLPVVYDHDSLRAERDYIKGNSDTGGKVNLDRFIEGLLAYCGNGE